MKAVQINSYGGLEVLEVKDNVPEPEAGPGEVLVDVHFAGINPVDWKLRAGYLKDYVPLNFPVTLGEDFSGVVTEVGEGVTNFKVGDEVYGQGGVLHSGSGAFAQVLAAKIDRVSPKPKNVGFSEAAALPLTGVSALQALEDHIKLQPGQKILIHGGAGGIGTMAIQLAKALGAYVATTVGPDDIDYVKGLGVDEVINYKDQKFEEVLKGFDAVYDLVGGETTERSFQVLKKGSPRGEAGGILVSMTGQPSQELAEKYDVTAIGQNTEATPERLKRLTELVESGKIKVHIDKIFPLESAKDAFEHLEKGHPKGKVVLSILTNI